LPIKKICRGYSSMIWGKLQNVNYRINTLRNSTARSWLSLQPERNFEIADIDKFHIANKQVPEDKVLETVFDPELQGIGQYYEYRIIED
jgi:hypothetical protein